jgi:hypothetical protein
VRRFSTAREIAAARSRHQIVFHALATPLALFRIVGQRQKRVGDATRSLNLSNRHGSMPQQKTSNDVI